MISSVRKKFDKNLYDDNDTIAKEKVIQYFNRIGMKADHNSDRYGIDLIVNNKFYCEVEVKHNWKSNTFPFPDLQLSERKRKFAILDTDEFPVVFMVMNYDHTNALVVKGRDVLSSPSKEIPNKYEPKGEYFFKIPVSNTIRIKL